MRKTIVVVASSTLATLALLAGCGSDNKSGGNALPGSPSTDRDPCGLLTDDQVAKAIGRTPKAHTPDLQTKPVVSCKWTTDVQDVDLHVAVGPAAGYTPPNLDKPPWEPVTGIGDKAAFSKTGPVLFTTGGGYGVQILPGPELTDEEKNDKTAGIETTKQAAITAARDVLAALGAGSKADAPAPKTTEPSTKKSSPKTTEPTETSEPKTTEPEETTITLEPPETTETE
jgi:hypothetical protein